MVRSATALIGVVILAGFTFVQQVTTHTVVKGDTLWDLAQTYYGNPFEWRRIWEANRSQISDPNLIYPGWELSIPGKEAQVGNVSVEAPAAAETPESPAPLPSVADTAPSNAPTIFRHAQPARGMVVGSSEIPHLAVSRDDVYSAPWLVREGSEPHSVGILRSMAGATTNTYTPRRFDKVHLTFEGSAPPVGTSLRLFRATKTIAGVGRVMTPTGVVSINTVMGDSAVAVVTDEYYRIQLGDLVGLVPDFSLKPGQYAQAVGEGSEAMIVGFATNAVLESTGEVAFLDQGLDDGVAVGDEYELVNPSLGTHPVEGRLQVVGVTKDGAAARIVQITDAVFRQGVAVRLSRKMR